MDGVIRKQPLKQRSAPRPASVLWLFVLLGLAIACLYLAWNYSSALGNTASIVMIGIAVMSLFLFVMLWIGRNRMSAKLHELEPEEICQLLVMHTDNPCVYLQNGEAVIANSEYFELAQSFGVASRSDIPPGPDRLFGDSERDVASTIFRLYHLDESGEIEERDIRINIDGLVRQMRVKVSAYKSGQVWDIVDLDKDQKHQAGLLSNAPVGLFAINAIGEILGANQNLEKWVGAPMGQFPSHLREFIENPEILIEGPKNSGRLVRADTRLITHRGIVTPVVLQAIWNDLGEGEFLANVALHGHSSLGFSNGVIKPSIADRKAETPVHNALDSEYAMAPIAFARLDGTELGKAKIISVNAAFEKMLGSEDWRERELKTLLKTSDMARDFLNMDASDCSPDAPFDGVLTGSQLAVSIYVVTDPMKTSCELYMVDVSARKALEDQLVQSQKMQAIGRLVAEIAHDFNNLLAAMRLYTDTLLGRHPIGDPSYPELQQINSNINRAASLVKKLLAYSRKQTIRAVRLDVSETLSDMAVTLKQVLGERVTLDIVHGRDLPQIRVDRSQLDTVLMNLAVNARDAMKEQGGGEIKIESRALKKADIKDNALKAALDSIKTDRIVVISVTDTGTGITDEIKSQIFEPFFTTKPQGEGTGLGLSTVYGIVQQSGGHLDIESELGVGTTFSIYLPEALKGADDAEEIPPVKISSRPSRPPADLAGQGNILFVEDEDSVRVIAAKTLRKRGYNVIEACDGEEAYDILSDAETPFDLMISDVVMPGMDGPTLLKKARKMIGDARIVFISGYAEEEFSDLLSEEPDVTFLPKPFTLIQLAEKVKSEIGEVGQ